MRLCAFKAHKGAGVLSRAGYTPAQYFEKGISTSLGVQPVVVMDWVDAKPLKIFLAEHIKDSSAINKIAENFKKMVSDLHLHHLSHGDLQHGNIMVKPDYSLVLVDYDSMYVPALNGMPDEIKGLAGYQHPARWKNEYVSEKADYFSELVIYLSLKALAKISSLWRDLNIENTETLLFTSEDIDSPNTSIIINVLKRDSELAPLAEKLCHFINQRSIEDLSPLEVVTTSLSQSISNKWKNGNGYIAGSKKATIVNPNDITKKWSSGNGYARKDSNEKNKELANAITQKFKKNE